MRTDWTDHGRLLFDSEDEPESYEVVVSIRDPDDESRPYRDAADRDGIEVLVGDGRMFIRCFWDQADRTWVELSPEGISALRRILDPLWVEYAEDAL